MPFIWTSSCTLFKIYAILLGISAVAADSGLSCLQGGWAHDLKQGLGKKVYANGDVYEGLWKAGKCEGPGRYRWKNRNEYDGEWKAGRMHGKGTLKWNTGNLLAWANSWSLRGFPTGAQVERLLNGIRKWYCA